MKLWRIWQSKFTGHDVYDSAVVAAETEEEARDTDPVGGRLSENFQKFRHMDSWDWPSSMEEVQAEYIGEAKEGAPAGVIVASFNAG